MSTRSPSGSTRRTAPPPPVGAAADGPATSDQRPLTASDRPEAILAAVAFVAERFLRGDALEGAYTDVLQHLGEASGASRVVLIERIEDPDGAFMTKRGEWDAPGIPPLAPPPDPRGYRYFPRWERELAAGHSVAGRPQDHPDDERIPLEEDGVGTIIVTPITVGNRWWGHVGYDDRQPDRPWLPAEIDALRAAAGILGAAIQQSEWTATIDRRNAILGAVADATPLLLATGGWQTVLPELLRSLRQATNARSAWAYEDVGGVARLITEDVVEGGLPTTSYGREVTANPAIDERLHRGEAIHNEYLTVDPEREAAAFAYLGIRSWVVVPVLSGGRLWGSIGLDSSDLRSWTEGEIVAVKVAAAALGATIERESTEERLRQLEKMDAVGRLAGGLAHDFGNLLAIISGNAHLIRDDAHTDTERADAQAVIDASGRGADLVRDLLTFSRQRVGEIQPVDLNDRISRVERILRRVIGATITIEVIADSSIPPVRADPAELEHVVVNLVVNARDAMPNGGRITIRTELARETPDMVTMTVTDTGSGMDEATRQRIFEPFFTTKPEGVGTGLGLATAYAALAGWGGSIEATSELGVGTTFRLLLRPASEA